MNLNRKSRGAGRCANGACVVATVTPEGTVNVSDEHGGVIELRPDVWDALLAAIRGEDYPRPWISSRPAGVEWIGMPPGSGIDHVVLRYTADEWVAFLAAVRDGQFGIDDPTT